MTTGEVVELWPEAQEFGFPDEEAAFALQFGHGVGLTIWEKPIFSRLVSLDHPEVIEEGMVFALETFWPASDGWSAARIEEQLVVTADGCEVITRFPAEDLLIAGKPFYTVGGTLPLERETQSNLNTELDSGDPAGGPEDAGRRCRRGGRPMSSVEAMLATGGAFVDGAWADGERETFAVIEPSTGAAVRRGRGRHRGGRRRGRRQLAARVRASGGRSRPASGER